MPAPLLSLVVAKSQGIQDCLDANGVDATDQALIYYYLVGLLAISGGGRRVKSQAAPSGASQSFEYSDLGDLYDQLLGSLSVVDKYGCAVPLTPAKPGGSTGFMVVKGTRC
ncbi:hypothetical protein [Herbaspirillum sp.]|uniref:DUF7370 family protein n=1 Tax=Herbaspirillum sp. TaxID=1890675 RepID=UPI00257DB454|nr:hypothetical protein [Herbaspirillum sp.]|tara:strand:+ start:16832 stop:17164 length:333 start_codon:yes stop_codon:yes gene_type:complete